MTSAGLDAPGLDARVRAARGDRGLVDEDQLVDPAALVAELELGLGLLGLKVAKIYQISISPFLEGIDLISKMFKILLDGSAIFSAPVFSEIFKILDLQNFGIYKIKFVEMSLDFSWIL